MMTPQIKAALDARGVVGNEFPNGDVFFRRVDGRGMYVRAFDDGTYDWSVNAVPNDANLMDFRVPEKHGFDEIVRRIDDFLDLTVPGRVIIDTLGLVDGSMQLGLSRDEAERFAASARGLIVDMHRAGMDAHEIRTRFGEIHEQLKTQNLDRRRHEV